MATLAEIKAKLTEYEAAIAAREAAQSQHEMDSTAMNLAISTEQVSRLNWIDAIRNENAVEDELGSLIVAHEPPALPA